MTSMSETAPAGRDGGGTRAEAEIPPSGWTAPQVRRLATSSAEAAPGTGPDAEVLS